MGTNSVFSLASNRLDSLDKNARGGTLKAECDYVLDRRRCNAGRLVCECGLRVLHSVLKSSGQECSGKAFEARALL